MVPNYRYNESFGGNERAVEDVNVFRFFMWLPPVLHAEPSRLIVCTVAARYYSVGFLAWKMGFYFVGLCGHLSVIHVDLPPLHSTDLAPKGRAPTNCCGFQYSYLHSRVRK